MVSIWPTAHGSVARSVMERWNCWWYFLLCNSLKPDHCHLDDFLSHTKCETFSWCCGMCDRYGRESVPPRCANWNPSPSRRTLKKCRPDWRQRIYSYKIHKMTTSSGSKIEEWNSKSNMSPRSLLFLSRLLITLIFSPHKPQLRTEHHILIMYVFAPIEVQLRKEPFSIFVLCFYLPLFQYNYSVNTLRISNLKTL